MSGAGPIPESDPHAIYVPIKQTYIPTRGLFTCDCDECVYTFLCPIFAFAEVGTAFTIGTCGKTGTMAWIISLVITCPVFSTIPLLGPILIALFLYGSQIELLKARYMKEQTSVCCALEYLLCTFCKLMQIASEFDDIGDGPRIGKNISFKKAKLMEIMLFLRANRSC